MCLGGWEHGTLTRVGGSLSWQSRESPVRVPSRRNIAEHFRRVGWPMVTVHGTTSLCFEIQRPYAPLRFATLDELWAYWREFAIEMIALQDFAEELHAAVLVASPAARTVLVEDFWSYLHDVPGTHMQAVKLRLECAACLGAPRNWRSKIEHIVRNGMGWDTLVLVHLRVFRTAVPCFKAMLRRLERQRPRHDMSIQRGVDYAWASNPHHRPRYQAPPSVRSKKRSRMRSGTYLA